MDDKGLPKNANVTTEQAARWMGVGNDLFIELASEFADWMRPVYFGSGQRKIKRWWRDDVICLAHIWHQRQTLPPQRQPKNEEAEE